MYVYPLLFLCLFFTSFSVIAADSKADTKKSTTTEQQKTLNNQDKRTAKKKNTKPNLGRDAAPLEEVILTPRPLPEVSVDLDNTQKETEPAEETTEAETTEIQPINLAPTKQVIQVDGELPKQQTAQRKIPYHNVMPFTIAGFGLGMNPDEVQFIAETNGFNITKQKMAVPLFKTFYYTTWCKEQGLYRMEDIGQCVEEYARENNDLFVEDMTVERPFTNEYIRILFTTHSTDNESFKIYYENKGDASIGWTYPDMAMRKLREGQFWKKMFDTYGYPDDPEELIWGDPKKAFMQARIMGSALNAYIVLFNRELDTDDYFSAEGEYKTFEYPEQFHF